MPEARQPPGASPAGDRPDQRLGRRQRLTRPALFAETYDQGRRWVGRYMVLWLRQGEGAALRLGVVSGRKVGNAVLRVRARRRLREIYRRQRARLSGAVDVILVARAGLPAARWDDAVRDFEQLAERSGLLKEGKVNSCPAAR